jgi:pheromone shutdown protein TraB
MGAAAGWTNPTVELVKRDIQTTLKRLIRFMVYVEDIMSVSLKYFE